MVLQLNLSKQTNASSWHKETKKQIVIYLKTLRNCKQHNPPVLFWKLWLRQKEQFLYV